MLEGRLSLELLLKLGVQFHSLVAGSLQVNWHLLLRFILQQPADLMVHAGNRGGVADCAAN